MKSKFIKISKICLFLFCVAIAILVGFAMIVKESEIALPTAAGIFVFLSIVAAMICIFIAIFAKAALCVCGIRAGNYIFSK